MASLDLEAHVRSLLRRAAGLELTIGIQAEQGAQRPAADEPTMLEIATWNHWGTRRIPARPWLIQARDKYGRDWLRAFGHAVQQPTEDQMETVIRQLGVVAVSDCQEVLTDLRDPPNAESTIAKKGSDNPLIDTGGLRMAHRAAMTVLGVREVIG
jgi:hypothetical protein